MTTLSRCEVGTLSANILCTRESRHTCTMLQYIPHHHLHGKPDQQAYSDLLKFGGERSLKNATAVTRKPIQISWLPSIGILQHFQGLHRTLHFRRTFYGTSEGLSREETFEGCHKQFRNFCSRFSEDHRRSFHVKNLPTFQSHSIWQPDATPMKSSE